MGDAVVNKNVVIKLTSAKFETGVLKAQFVLYNGGQQNVTISSLMSFDAKDGDGNKGKYQISTDAPSLDGGLVPGDTLRGTLVYGFDPGAKGLKLYYTDSLFGGDTIVFGIQ